MAEMQTYSARLASFSKAQPATKKRTSEAKGAKSLKWPHKVPSPAQLAKAGFYYHPTTSCLDNATCFICQSNLDGWEKDDDPIVEHLKHSPSCGWAITIYTEQSIEGGNTAEENPMSEGMLSARTMTFGTQWPHENKRGWTCKTQKLVNAGWYYCPTPESDDFVKCAYCNLSLDGWEPKDNPYDEHQRRSPECMFFTLSSLVKLRAGRPKKGRMSKASRMSTASNISAAIEGQYIADLPENEGNTTMMSPTGSVKSIKTEKLPKKGRKFRKPYAKAKSELAHSPAEEITLASSFVEPEDDDFEVKVEPNPKKAARGRKRNSDEMSTNGDKISNESRGNRGENSQLRPAKRRATRTRSSVAQSTVASVLAQENQIIDMHTTDAENAPPTIPIFKKGTKGGRKRASSAVRKASAASTASMASLRAIIPDDEDIDAALEADLDRPLTDDEDAAEQLEVVHPKTRRLTRTKPGSNKPTASVASARRTTRTSVVATSDVPIGHGDIPHSSLLGQDPASAAVSNAETVSIQTAKTKAAKGKNTRKTSAKQPNPTSANVVQEDHMVDCSTNHEDVSVMPMLSRSRQPSRQLPQRKTRASDLVTALENVNMSSLVNSSILEPAAGADEPAHETDHSVVSQTCGEQGRKKDSTAPLKGKAGKKAALKSRKIEDIIQPAIDEVAFVKEAENVMEIDYPELAEPKTKENEPAEEDVKPKKKSTKSSKAKANKPASKKADPSKTSSPQAESSKHPSPTPSPPPAQPAETVTHSPTPALPDHEPRSPLTVTAASSPQPPNPAHTPRKPPSPRQSSDAENEPPSSRPSEFRPPLSTSSPTRPQTIRFPLAASTPTISPSKQNASKLTTTLPWTAIDFDKFFSPAEGDKENSDASVFKAVVGGVDGGLASPEKKMSVEQWILFRAKKSEEKLKGECERLVGRFEGEGVRALRVLEGVECVD